MAMNISKIESEIESLRRVKTLPTGEALSRVHDIIKMMGKDIEVQMENENFEALLHLYEKATEVYLLAAEKVPKEKWGILASPSSFWELRAEQTRLKLNLKKPLHTAGIDTIKPFLESEIDTIKPFLESEIDISKPIPKISLQYPKVKIEDVIRGYELKGVHFEPITPLVLPSPKIELKKIAYNTIAEPLKPPLFYPPYAPAIELKDVAQCAVISPHLEVQSNIEPLLKSALTVGIHEQQNVYKDVSHINTTWSSIL